MKYLFICSTQYHLMLAYSLAIKIKEEDIHAKFDMIICSYIDISNTELDFENIKKQINIIDYIDRKALSDYFFYKDKVSKIKKIILNNKYYEILVNKDINSFEQNVISNHSNVTYIEDGGAIYVNNENSEKVLNPMHILKYIKYRFYYGISKPYIKTIHGKNPKIKKLYVLFKKCVNASIDKKIIVEIDSKYFISGIYETYKEYIGNLEKQKLVFEHNSKIIFLDHSIVFEEGIYRYKEFKEKIIKEINSYDSDEKIFIKYHPRENSWYFNEISNQITNKVIIIPNNIPAEVIYYLVRNKERIEVLSGISTAIITSKKINPKIKLKSFAPKEWISSNGKTKIDLTMFGVKYLY